MNPPNYKGYEISLSVDRFEERGIYAPARFTIRKGPTEHRGHVNKVFLNRHEAHAAAHAAARAWIDSQFD